MASKRIIMKQSHTLGHAQLAARSYQLFDDAVSAELVAAGVAAYEQDLLDGKIEPDTLEPKPTVFEAMDQIDNFVDTAEADKE